MQNTWFFESKDLGNKIMLLKQNGQCGNREMWKPIIAIFFWSSYNTRWLQVYKVVLLITHRRSRQSENNSGLEWSQNHENQEIMLHKFPRRDISSRNIKSFYWNLHISTLPHFKFICYLYLLPGHWCYNTYTMSLNILTSENSMKIKRKMCQQTSST